MPTNNLESPSILTTPLPGVLILNYFRNVIVAENLTKYMIMNFSKTFT